MITVTAVGFISEKPQLVPVTANSQKCEFDVVWGRSAKEAGTWVTKWERATFVAWNEEAERIATQFEKGHDVTCTGVQETSTWEDRQSGQKRFKVKYRLTAWNRHFQPQGGGGNRSDRDARPAAPQQPSRAPYNQPQDTRRYNSPPDAQPDRSQLDRDQHDDGHPNDYRGGQRHSTQHRSPYQEPAMHRSQTGDFIDI